VGDGSDAGTLPFQITDRNLAEVTFVLKWTDEPDHDRLHENQPDELGIDVLAPWGVNQTQSAKNPQGAEGSVTVTFAVSQFKLDGDNGTGDWNYTVFAKTCGEHTPKYVGILMWLDNGNAFSLEISYKYYTKPGSK
jgi:hypothetical protein